MAQTESDHKAPLRQPSFHGSRTYYANCQGREAAKLSYPSGTTMSHDKYQHDKVCVKMHSHVSDCDSVSCLSGLQAHPAGGKSCLYQKLSQLPMPSEGMDFRRESTTIILLDQHNSLHILNFILCPQISVTANLHQSFLLRQRETITENHKWTLCRDQCIRAPRLYMHLSHNPTYASQGTGRKRRAGEATRDRIPRGLL